MNQVSRFAATRADKDATSAPNTGYRLPGRRNFTRRTVLQPILLPFHIPPAGTDFDLRAVRFSRPTPHPIPFLSEDPKSE
ncbi:uncharacterized protein Dmul_15540 [Desulfococcus multivorans]|nr:uncharacterized protein Dmul_15540 [Desulfococcus multivorans]